MDIIAPSEYVGSLMDLCNKRRGEFKDLKYLAAERTQLSFDLPLSEVISNFFDELKSKTRGYGAGVESRRVAQVIHVVSDPSGHQRQHCDSGCFGLVRW